MKNMKKSQWYITLTSLLVLAALVFTASSVMAQDATDAAAIEGQLLAAQKLIVSGKLDDGLDTLHKIISNAAPDMAGRVAFIEKLIEVRVADRLNDPAKVLAGLTEAVKLATQPDQKDACWQLSFEIAKANVAAKKSSEGDLLDFLSAKIVPDMQQVFPHIELAKLYIAVGRSSLAETELAKAGFRIEELDRIISRIY